MRSNVLRNGWVIGIACFALLAAAAGWPAAAAVSDAPRVALVIGNAAYRGAPLRNPLNDARAVARALGQLGFQVITVENASQAQMFEAVRKFGDSLRNGVGLFYYAGHGVQVGGRNFLVPVDVAIEREDELAYRALDANLVLEKMEAAHNVVNIVILDACRGNPFASRGMRISTENGLAQMDAPAGSLIAFATAPGADAADGSGANGLYTGSLLEFITTPGLRVEDVFKRTRVAVKRKSDGRQIPWESSSLEGDFFFAAPVAGHAAAAADAAELENEMWELVAESGRPSAYRAYLEKFPNGAHAEQAQRLASAGAAAAPDVAAPPAMASNAFPKHFSFSEEEAKMDRRTSAGRDAAFRQAVAIDCAPARRNARVRIQLDERGGDVFAAALSERLVEAGLRVGAGASDYVIRGTVSRQVHANRMLAVDEIAINAAVTLASSSGQLVSSRISREESYAGSDVAGAYADLVQTQTGELAARLYSDLCRI
jgi:Caspase domain